MLEAYGPLVLILQYYVYELLDDGTDCTAQCPSLACPYAVVAFSYRDTKATLETQQKKRYFDIATSPTKAYFSLITNKLFSLHSEKKKECKYNTLFHVVLATQAIS